MDISLFKMSKRSLQERYLKTISMQLVISEVNLHSNDPKIYNSFAVSIRYLHGVTFDESLA